MVANSFSIVWEKGLYFFKISAIHEGVFQAGCEPFKMADFGQHGGLFNISFQRCRPCLNITTLKKGGHDGDLS